MGARVSVVFVAVGAEACVAFGLAPVGFADVAVDLVVDLVVLAFDGLFVVVLMFASHL